MSEKGRKITYKFNKNAYNFKTTQANAVIFLRQQACYLNYIYSFINFKIIRAFSTEIVVQS